MSNYDSEIFKNLLVCEKWDEFDNTQDVNQLWKIFNAKLIDILAIMCPFKRFKQREKITPWIGPDIYRAMRERDFYIKLFKITRCHKYLVESRPLRNKVNGLIHRAKSDYIKSQLRSNRNPKKFWRIIKDSLKPKDDVTMSARYIDPLNGEYVDTGNEANFLNEYFVNIVKNLYIPEDNDAVPYEYNHGSTFCFTDNMPTQQEIIKLIKDIDVNKSSCVEKVNAKYCKDAMLAVPKKIWHMITISLTMGIVPSEWTKELITVLPKEGDLRKPGNWRPINQSSMFAKLLEKIVHTRILKYLIMYYRNFNMFFNQVDRLSWRFSNL